MAYATVIINKDAKQITICDGNPDMKEQIVETCAENGDEFEVVQIDDLHGMMQILKQYNGQYWTYWYY